MTVTVNAAAATGRATPRAPRRPLPVLVAAGALVVVTALYAWAAAGRIVQQRGHVAAAVHPIVARHVDHLSTTTLLGWVTAVLLVLLGAAVLLVVRLVGRLLARDAGAWTAVVLLDATALLLVAVLAATGAHDRPGGLGAAVGLGTLDGPGAVHGSGWLRALGGPTSWAAVAEAVVLLALVLPTTLRWCGRSRERRAERSWPTT